MLSKKVSGIFVLVIAHITTILALEPQDYEAVENKLSKNIEECGIEHDVNKSTVIDAFEHEYLHRLNPCFLGCVFEKIELIDDKGKVQIDVAAEKLQKYTDGSYYEMILNILDKCSEKVNSASSEDICESGFILAPCLYDGYSGLIGGSGVEYA